MEHFMTSLGVKENRNSGTMGSAKGDAIFSDELREEREIVCVVRESKIEIVIVIANPFSFIYERIVV